MDIALPAAAPAKISSVFNITDEVLRYLLVRVDRRSAKMAEKAKDAEDTKANEEKED